MGRRSLALLDRSLRNARPAARAPQPEGHERPILAVIVGGKPEYSNVAKLPGLLWDEYGILVVEHWTKSCGSTKGLQLGIGLIDQVGHGVLADARKGINAEGGHMINTPSSWSRIKTALTDIGITPYEGRHLKLPKKKAPKTPKPRQRKRLQDTPQPAVVVRPKRAAEPPAPKPEPQPTPQPKEVPVAEPAKTRTPEQEWESDIRATLKKLVGQMKDGHIKTLRVTDDGDVDIERVQIVKDSMSLD